MDYSYRALGLLDCNAQTCYETVWMLTLAAKEKSMLHSMFHFLWVGALVGIFGALCAFILVQASKRNAPEKAPAQTDAKPPRQEPHTELPPTKTTSGKSHSEGDVTWNFDMFLGLSSSSGKEPVVGSFQAFGINNLDDPLSHVS